MFLSAPPTRQDLLTVQNFLCEPFMQMRHDDYECDRIGTVLLEGGRTDENARDATQYHRHHR